MNYPPVGIKIKKAASILIFIFVWVHPVFATDIDITIHVDDGYRPFSYVENGEPKGIYIEILNTAFSRMNGFNVKIVPVPWNRGKMLMKTGKGFALAPVFYHGHDWPYLHPYSLAFYTETIVAVCRETTLDQLKGGQWPHDYVGLKIGNVSGFDGWGGDEFRSLVSQGKIKYEEAKGSRTNILKLVHGRVDCIMMEDKAFDYEAKKLIGEGRLTAAQLSKLKKGAQVSRDPVYIGYSKTARENGFNNSEFEFMQAFDSQIYQMIKSGEIDRILKTYEY